MSCCGGYVGCGTGYGSLGYNFDGNYGYGNIYGYGDGYGSYHDGWRVSSTFGPYGYGCGPYGACGPCSGIYQGVNYYRRFN